jgi:hypothetical protein
VSRLRRFPGALLVLLSASLGPATGVVGCGDDGPTSGAGGGAASGAGGFGGIDASLLPYEPCAADAKVGWFEIELGLERGIGYTRAGGQVSDAVRSSQISAVLASEGDCRLLSPMAPACDPGCTADEQCSRDAVCVPLPRNRDVGTVTVRGLVVPLAMEPNDVTRTYSNPALPILPHPGFLPGADLRINTEGGDYAPFELRGWGISPLVLSGEVIDVRRGQPARLAWEAPSAPGPARVNVVLNINFHGVNGAWVECDFPDTGAGEIPAVLVDGLFEQGLSGNPTLTAVRRSVTSAEIEPGCVDMLVYSAVSTPVQVEGIVSCRTSSDCPPPQQCIPVELFCE